MRPNLGILALLLTPPGLPSGGFHWQRTVTPPPGAPTAQACVVLDAATFANAAPALRDLRLFQDGTELPYAIEESYDPRALESGVTPDDDRSLYEPSVVAQPANVPYPGPPPSSSLSRQGRHILPGEPDPLLGFLALDVPLPAHVPVERLRLEPTPTVRHVIHLRATGSASPPAGLTETVDGVVDADHPTLALTLGANLQKEANVTLQIEGSTQPVTRVLLEMRRRSLCYQPRSASPLTLYLGGGAGMAAKTYNYASSFSTALDRPYATLGPLVPNADDPGEVSKPANPRRKRLLWAASLAAAFFVFSAARMLRRCPA